MGDPVATVNIDRVDYCDVINVNGGAKLIGTWVAGDDIPACSPCYIDGDGLVQMAVSTQATRAVTFPDFVGVNRKVVSEGQSVSLYGYGTKMVLADADDTLTIGTYLYVSDTAGEWALGDGTSDLAIANAASAIAQLVSLTEAIIIV